MSFGNVEERVVEMVFDNKKFEENAQQSLNTLNAFDKSLNNMGGASALTAIGDAASRLTFSGIQNGVEAVGQKFNALEVMAVTALMNITNSAVNYGKRIANALTIQPISTGFNEYEQKMGAIQTILAATESKGETLETVTGYIQELNKYADKTIYSFRDMTQNIGKFTNAGVDLDVAVKAIQGISNEAALSGANAAEASRAMYNFSQALSAGYVKMIDWRSIQNANMATADFKQQLIDTAVELGTLSKNADGTYNVLTKGASGSFKETITNTKNFEESLHAAWMTSDVLTQTLTKYADETTEIGKKAFAAAQDVKTYTQMMDTLKEAAQSGWAETFEILFGNLEEAKKLWTGISQVVGGFIDQSAKQRNDLLQGWKDAGGRAKLIEALTTAFESLSKIFGRVHKEFVRLFPPVTSEQLVSITEKFAAFIESLKPSKTTLKTIQRVFRGFFSILKLGVDVVGGFVRAFAPLVTDIFGFIGDAAGGFLQTLSDWGLGIRDFQKSFEKNDSAFKFFKAIADFIRDIGSGAFNTLKDFVSAIESFTGIDFHIPTFQDFANVLGNIKEFLSPLGGLFSTVSEAVRGFFGAFSSEGEDVGILPGILNALGKAFNFLYSAAKKVVDTVAPGLVELFSGIKENIKNADFGAIANAIKDIGIGLAGFGAFSMFNKKKGEGVGLLSFIDGLIPKDVLETLKTVGETAKGIFDSVKSSIETWQNSIKADILIKIAAAIGILTVSLVILAAIDKDALGKALGAITVAFADLVGAFTAINKLAGDSNGKSIMATGQALIEMSAAVLILSFAMRALSKIDEGTLLTSLLAISVLLFELVVVAQVLDGKTEGFKKSAVSLIAMAIALKILSSSVAKLAAIDPSTFAQGLIGVIALVGALAAFLKIVDGVKFGVSTGVGLIAMGAALLIVTSAVEKMGALDSAAFEQGLIGLGAALLGIAAALKLMPDDVFKTSMGLLVLSAALTVISKVIADIGSLDFGSAILGFGVLAGLIAVMTAAMVAMNGVKARTSVGLLVMAAAINVLVPALKALGNLSLKQIAMALGSLVGIFVVLGAAGYLLGPVVPVIMLLAKALGIIGISVFAVGAGLFILAKALSSLALAGTTAVVAIVAQLGIIFAAIINAIPVLIVTIIGAIANGIVMFCKIIADSAMSIAKSVQTVVMAVISVLGSAGNLLMFAGVVLSFIVTLLNTLSASIPSIIDAGINLMINFVNGMADGLRNHSEEILGAVGNLLSSIIEMVLTALAAIAGSIPGVGGQIADFINGAKEDVNAALVPDELKQKGTETGKALAEGIREGTIDAGGAGADLKKAVVDGFAGGESGKQFNLGDDLISGVTGDAGAAQNAGNELGTNVLTGFKNGLSSGPVDVQPVKLSDFGFSAEGLITDANGAGSDISQGLSDGMLNNPAASNAAGSLGTGIIDAARAALDSHSPSLAFEAIGQDAVQGLVNGLNNGSDTAAAASAEAASAGLTEIQKRLQQYNELGKTTMMRYALGLRARTAMVVAAARSVVIQSYKAANSYQGQFYTAGQYAVAGFVRGMYSRQSSASSAGWSIGRAAYDSARRALDEHSPSKAFEKLGVWADEGLIIGFESLKEKVSKSSASIGLSATDSLSAQLRRLPDVADMDVTPTITPVLDISNIMTGSRLISGILNNQAVSIDGLTASINVSNAQLLSDISDAVSGISFSNDDVVSAIESLKADNAALRETIANMKVMLNRRIVGQIDNGLGQQQLLANRGV